MSVRSIFAAVGMVLAATSAHAADFAVAPAPEAVVAPPASPCAEPDVLANIMERFAWAEEHTFHRGFVMASLDNPRLRYDATASPSLIPRHYCEAAARMTNDSTNIVYYAIEHGVGFASIGDYVDFCVLGLDPWYVHDFACRTVR